MVIISDIVTSITPEEPAPSTKPITISASYVGEMAVSTKPIMVSTPQAKSEGQAQRPPTSPASGRLIAIDAMPIVRKTGIASSEERPNSRSSTPGSSVLGAKLLITIAIQNSHRIQSRRLCLR